MRTKKTKLHRTRVRILYYYEKENKKRTLFLLGIYIGSIFYY